MIISDDGEVLSFSWPQNQNLFQEHTGCDNFYIVPGDQARDLPDADEGWGGGEGDGQQL